MEGPMMSNAHFCMDSGEGLRRLATPSCVGAAYDERTPDGLTYLSVPVAGGVVLVTKS
jgi:hypothetical protein